MGALKTFVLGHPHLKSFALFIYTFFPKLKLSVKTKRAIRQASKNNPKSVIFYLGKPAHANLGDLAQGVCIQKWIREHYSENSVVAIETNAIVNTPFSVLPYLKKHVKKTDVFFFQSGYTTTDLGGYADLMHRTIVQAFPNNRMLMFPQTIFFKDPKNQENSSRIYQMNSNLVFLARDSVSYDMAKVMFPGLKKYLFPDIVTSLIGSEDFSKQSRKGILFCCRNDGEKFYSEEDIKGLMSRCSALDEVKLTDTTIHQDKKSVVANPEAAVAKEIEGFSHYRVIITDRYHGTIFSLVAATPVIVLKTTDHKVVTGVDWFKGVYDGHVFLAKDLEEAFSICQRLFLNPPEYQLKPYFKEKYYDPLLQIVGWGK